MLPNYVSIYVMLQVTYYYNHRRGSGYVHLLCKMHYEELIYQALKDNQGSLLLSEGTRILDWGGLDM